MGHSVQSGLAKIGLESGTDSIQFEQALRCHLTGNFYPPLPEAVKDNTVTGIQEFNNGECTIEELADKCSLKNPEAVLKYHGCFLVIDEDEFM